VRDTVALNQPLRMHSLGFVLPPVRDTISLKQPVIVLPVPKCGTHLLVNILLQIFGSNNVHGFEGEHKMALIDDTYLSTHELSNKLYCGHIWHSGNLSDKLKKVPKIILVRDPRDYVVSHAHHYDYLNIKENDVDEFFQKLDDSDKLSAAILGVTTRNGIISPVYDMFVNYAIKWLDSSCMVVRFEDLVSSTPGKIEEKTINVVKSIIKFIAPDTSFDSNIMDDIFLGSDPSISITFRKGKVGKWKEEFNPLHIKQFKITAPSLLSSLGYENDEDWDLNKNIQYDKPSIKSIARLPPTIKNISDRYAELSKLPHSDNLKHLIDVWALTHFVEIPDFENTLIILNSLLEKDPNNRYWNYLKAFCLLSLNKDLEVSLQHFNVAEKNGYDKFWVRYHRGQLYARLGNTKLAITDLEQALTVLPNDKSTLTLLNNLKNKL
jgi:hypothetical protein